MKDFGLKACFFLFLVAVLSGRTNELGTLTGAIAGTILFWPIYLTALGAAARENATKGSDRRRAC